LNKEKVKSNVCQIKDCGRPTHKESKYCIFHASAEEKTEEEFKKALKEYIKEIEKENKGYNFNNFIFIGYIEFINFVFNNKYTSFQEATFEGDIEFIASVFIGCSLFFKTTFKGYAKFIGADFQGYADFREATFKGNVNFYHATFEGAAYFENTTFKRNADFTKVNFLRLNDFMGATFKGETYFNNATLSQGEKLILKVKKGGSISFIHALLENIFLDLDLVDGVLVDFTDALLRNTKIKKKQIENHILQDKEKKYSKANEIYLLLKNNFHTIGRYEDESWAFKKEKDMDRLSHWFFSVNREKERNNEKKKNKTVFVPPEIESSSEEKKYSFLRWIFSNHFSKWFFSGVSNIIYGYGERPWNVIKTAVAIILIFALSFSFIGLGNPEIIELKGTAIHQNSGNTIDLISKGLLKNNVIRNFPDSLYFSTITFTTLGYGDFRPLEGWGRILAGSEAFIGAFMMALFVYTFARRTGGR